MSGGWDGVVKVWEVESWECVQTLRGHERWVTSCAYSLDGTRIVSGAPGELFIWDAKTGARLLGIHLFRDGEYCVENGDGTAVLAATPEAWRTLRYQLFDTAGRLVDVVPAETFGPLPLARRG